MWSMLVGPQGWRVGWSRMEMEEDGGASRGTEKIPTTGSMMEGETRVAKTQALPLPDCVTLSKAPNLSGSHFPPLQSVKWVGFL